MDLFERWFRGNARKPAWHADDLALYHFPACPYCRRVRRAAKRLGVALPLRNVHRDPTAQAELLAGGGRPMVPCLRIHTDTGDTWMYESHVIVRYLQQRMADHRGQALAQAMNAPRFPRQVLEVDGSEPLPSCRLADEPCEWQLTPHHHLRCRARRPTLDTTKPPACTSECIKQLAGVLTSASDRQRLARSGQSRLIGECPLPPARVTKPPTVAHFRAAS